VAPLLEQIERRICNTIVAPMPGAGALDKFARFPTPSENTFSQGVGVSAKSSVGGPGPYAL
jgi:hypothetical protein